jgi:mannose-1-phosphate guanylyltransferase
MLCNRWFRQTAPDVMEVDSMKGRVHLLPTSDSVSPRSHHLWGIVLAGGSTALLRRTIERAALLMPHRRIITVTARRHPRSARLAVALPRVQRIVQPSYRGSAPEILLPALKLAHRDPHATVVILPGDLLVEHEARFVSYVERAISAVELRPDLPVLLGAQPRTPDPARGWIEPGALVEGLEPLSIHAIARFVERPSRVEIGVLFEGTGLLSTRIVIARAHTLVELGKRYLPEVLETLEPLEDAFGRPEEPLLCDAVYECMPRASLWRALLVRRAVAVLPIPAIVGSKQGPSPFHALAS